MESAVTRLRLNPLTQKNLGYSLRLRTPFQDGEFGKLDTTRTAIDPTYHRQVHPALFLPNLGAMAD